MSARRARQNRCKRFVRALASPSNCYEKHELTLVFIVIQIRPAGPLIAMPSAAEDTQDGKPAGTRRYYLLRRPCHVRRLWHFEADIARCRPIVLQPGDCRV